MEVQKVSINNNLYDIVSNTKDEIVLERFDNEIGMKFEFIFENTDRINKEITEILKKRYLNRVANFTHLINVN